VSSQELSDSLFLFLLSINLLVYLSLCGTNLIVIVRNVFLLFDSQHSQFGDHVFECQTLILLHVSKMPKFAVSHED